MKKYLLIIIMLINPYLNHKPNRKLMCGNKNQIWNFIPLFIEFGFDPPLKLYPIIINIFYFFLLFNIFIFNFGSNPISDGPTLFVLECKLSMCSLCSHERKVDFHGGSPRLCPFISFDILYIDLCMLTLIFGMACMSFLD